MQHFFIELMRITNVHQHNFLQVGMVEVFLLCDTIVLITLDTNSVESYYKSKNKEVKSYKEGKKQTTFARGNTMLYWN